MACPGEVRHRFALESHGPTPAASSLGAIASPTLVFHQGRRSGLLTPDTSACPKSRFVTCARLPDLDADDRLALEPLTQLGCHVTAAVWDDPDVDWDRFDVSVLRSTWDYTDRRDDFVRWALSVPRLLNPAHVVEWNTDKRYLAELARLGRPGRTHTWISSGSRPNCRRTASTCSSRRSARARSTPIASTLTTRRAGLVPSTTSIACSPAARL